MLLSLVIIAIGYDEYKYNHLQDNLFTSRESFVFYSVSLFFVLIGTKKSMIIC